MLDAEVVGDDAESRCRPGNSTAVEIETAVLPAIGRARGDDTRQIHAGQPRKAARGGQRALRRIGLHRLGTGHDAAGLRAVVAQDARQLARIQAGDADDAMPREAGRQTLLTAPIAGQPRYVTYDQPGRVHGSGLGIGCVAAGIADVRIGQGDDLPGVGRIAEYLLVAGDGGVEHHLAHGLAGRANADALEDRAVFEGQQGGNVHAVAPSGCDKTHGPALGATVGRGFNRRARIVEAGRREVTRGRAYRARGAAHGRWSV